MIQTIMGIMGLLVSLVLVVWFSISSIKDKVYTLHIFEDNSQLNVKITRWLLFVMLVMLPVHIIILFANEHVLAVFVAVAFGFILSMFLATFIEKEKV